MEYRDKDILCRRFDTKTNIMFDIVFIKPYNGLLVIRDFDANILDVHEIHISYGGFFGIDMADIAHCETVVTEFIENV